MNTLKTYLLLGLHILLFQQNVFSQDFSEPQRRITFEDGLNDESVTCITQDSLGYLWIGTTGGLNRYDGSEFLSWTIDDSLNSNWILSLQYDSYAQRLWIGTSEGLNYMELKSNMIHTFEKNSRAKFDVSSNWITGLIQVKKDELWCYNNGLLRLDFKNDTKQEYAVAHGRKSNMVTCVIQDQENKNVFWCGTANGLAEFDLNEKEFVNHYFFKHHEQELEANINLIETFLYQDLNGIVYGGCLNGGLFIYNPKTKEVKNFSEKYNGINFSNEVIYRQIVELNKSQILIFTNLGPLVYDINRKRIVDYFESDDYVSKTFAPCYKDKFDRLWISAINGINVYNLKEEFFLVCPLDKKVLGQNYRLKSFVEDTMNQVLYFLKDQGNEVYVYDLKKNILKNPLNKFIKKKGFLSSNAMTVDLLLDSKNDLYLLCIDKLYRLHEDEWVPTDILPKLDMLPYASIVEMENEKLLTASIYKGLYVYDQKSDSSSTILPEELLGDGYWAYDIFQGHNNGVWITQLGRGMTYFDSDLNKKEQINFWNKDKKIGRFSVKDLLLYEGKGFLICGASKGVLLGNPTGIIDTIEIGRDKPSIHAFSRDKNQNIWMMANKGLYNANASLDAFNYYSYPSPIFNITTELTQGKRLLSLSDGRIMFAGSSALAFFEPKKMRSNPEITNPRIASIVTDENVFTRSELNNPIEFSYQNNALLFSLSGINFTKGFAPLFKYKLEGIDENWTNGSLSDEVKYGNLSPGHYTFKLKASNSDRIWSQNSDEVKFTILPPWWKTWWAYLLYLFLACSGFLIWYKYQKNKWQLESALLLEKEKNNKLVLQKKADMMNALLEGAEKERMRLSRELHDGVGAVVASAGMFIESLAHKFSILKKDDQYNKSKNMVKESYEEIRALSHQLMPLKFRKLGFKKLIHDLVDDLAQAGGLRTKCKLEFEDANLKEQIQQYLHRIIQEILKNILQHAEASEIELSIKIVDKDLLLKICNDGVTFQLEEGLAKEGLGLKNILYRVDVLKGDLSIYADGQSRTHYSIQIPLE